MEKQIQKNKTSKCRRKSNGGFLGFAYARCWVVNKLETIEDEGGKTYPNKANTFLRKCTKDVLVTLV
jgi:hypothetical protein